MRVAGQNGWVTPLANSGAVRSAWVPATLEQSIAQNIRAAVLTRRGERLLQPKFGSLVHEFFFRVLDSALIAELEAHLVSVLSTCEPRISVKSVEIQKESVDASEIQLSIQFEVLETERRSELRIAVRP